MPDKDEMCPTCLGKGTVTTSKFEEDTSAGVALGLALRVGYFPVQHLVYKTDQCAACQGRGKRTQPY